jgi:hypothetical protein
MYRKLIEAGRDPATPLHASRGDNLALTISTIGWGARHTVEDSHCGAPVLRPLSTADGYRISLAHAPGCLILIERRQTSECRPTSQIRPAFVAYS